MGRALPHHDAPDRPAAAEARRPGPLVDLQVLLHGAVAVGGGVVVDGRAASLDRLREHRTDLAVKACLVGRTKGRRPAQRVETGAPERLVRVDVADAGDERLVKEQRLEPRVAASQPRPERAQGERVVERLGPVAREQLAAILGAIVRNARRNLSR